MKAVDVHYKEEYIIYSIVLLLGVGFCYLSLPHANQPTFLFYSGSLILSMLCIYYSELSKNRFVSILFLLVGLAILGFPMAFRLPIAVDDENYMHLFYRAKEFGFKAYLRTSDQEKGYLALNWIIYRFVDGDYNYFVTAITYLTFFLWLVAFKTMGNQKGSGMFMALFLWSHFYFFVLNSGLIRLFMALPITFIGIQHVWKGNWKWFTFWVVLAAFIHMSSLVMLLFLLFFIKQKFFYKHWGVFVILTIFVVFISFISMANFLIPILGDRYEGYGEIDELSFSAGSFTSLPIWLVCYYYFKNLPTVSDDYRKKYIVGMILLSLSIIFPVAASMVHIGRVIFYAYLGMMVVISAIFQIRTRNATDMIVKCMLIVYALVYVMSTNMLNDRKTQLFPYQSFLWDE